MLVVASSRIQKPAPVWVWSPRHEHRHDAQNLSKFLRGRSSADSWSEASHECSISQRSRLQFHGEMGPGSESHAHLTLVSFSVMLAAARFVHACEEILNSPTTSRCHAGPEVRRSRVIRAVRAGAGASARSEIGERNRGLLQGARERGTTAGQPERRACTARASQGTSLLCCFA